MAAVSAPTPKLDRYIVIHVATTCDEHGVYVTKDSAEVIELGWILLDTKTCEEVYNPPTFFEHEHLSRQPKANLFSFQWYSCTAKVSSSSRSTRQSLPSAVRFPCPRPRTTQNNKMGGIHENCDELTNLYSEFDDSHMGARPHRRYLPRRHLPIRCLCPGTPHQQTSRVCVCDAGFVGSARAAAPRGS